MLDDPDAPTIYRVSGEPPFPDPARPSLPASVVPRHVTLRDRQTVATIVPFASRYQAPDSLLRYLNDQFNKEIEGGDTYPMMEIMPFEKFASYWFQNFGAIMLLGDIGSADEVVDGKDWSKECLGTFYIKPNYPGRSSHVCNAGFIVTDASRNRGVGRLMGETYLEWAPKLGYTYSVFNLVYETNVASCKIWDALGFKRIGRVKGCGNLKSYPDRLIDAIIYGRDLGDDNGSNEELVSEERFDKIKFYLKYGRYPNGADRAEKSRLRSAATHYKLLDNDVLMLKDKEVISDPQRQYDIARSVHNQTHAGINKTTATIAERYHWSRIKETVSDVIRNCVECKELGKAQLPLPGANNGSQTRRSALSAPPSATIPSKRSSPSPSATGPRDISVTGQRGLTIPDHNHIPSFAISSHAYAHPNDMAMVAPSHTLQATAAATIAGHGGSLPRHNPMLQDQSHGLHSSHHATNTSLPLQSPHSVSDFQPIDPQIISQPSSHAHHHSLHHYSFHHNPHSHDPDADTFQALLNGTSDVDPDLDHHHHHHHHHHGGGSSHHVPSHEEDEADQAAVDRDLEMLIEPQEDDDEDEDAAAVMAVDIAMDNAVGSDEASRTGNAKMDVNHLLSPHVDVRDSSGRDGEPGRGRGVYDVSFEGEG